ncbi:yippee family putative zinc-binding protein [Artemisia annua]|uniref:Protein yippee-like n=1 Tax=Artemisia annua TaxID=35608 RepID=A0A2U1L7I8_ARTAN|nr:yippee family putative zinc-binding protein [Artemisia annua]
MGQMDDLDGHPLYSCNRCRNPITLRQNLLSKAFKARSGDAYMFSEAMNVVLGVKREAQLITGRFVVADVSCRNCGEVLGWKYLKAFEDSQRYKIGRFIIEKSKILKEYS